jgi:hypothetical protein
VDWSRVESLVLLVSGWGLGILSTRLAQSSVQRLRKRDDAKEARKIVDSLTVESEQGLERAKYMAKLATEGHASYGRIYTALWDSLLPRLVATLDDAETLRLLHVIYHRFDLINFNCEAGRAAAGGAFARDGVPIIEDNLADLKARSACR